MSDPKFKTLAEPFRIKMVEPLRITSPDFRRTALAEASYNPFLLNADDVFIDLLTDSGTSAMSDNQWAALMQGDESYAGASSWHHLHDVVSDLTGMPYIFPTHQGRAAERILYGVIGGPGKFFFSNTHFDTTRANIEYSGAIAEDLMTSENLDPQTILPFKGNIDLVALEKRLNETPSDKVGAVIITVTNNSSGGQPVSMANVKAARELCDRFGIRLVIDGCRIAENSYFIKRDEPGYTAYSYLEIAKEMLRLGDAFIMSAKKDGLVNMGGLLCMSDSSLSEACRVSLIITEGFPSYGGLTGRDMEALAVGLKEVFDADYLEYRIRSTEYLGTHLHSMGIPVYLPIGGHAVYVDARKLYDHIPVEHYPGQALVCDLYITGGVRTVEIGSVMFGKNGPDGTLIPAANELVRLAIPRRVYTQSHIDYVIEAFGFILEDRRKNKGYRITYEPPFLRHFTAHLAPV